MGFLKKLFRRKRTGEDVADSKKNTKGRKGKGKEKVLPNDIKTNGAGGADDDIRRASSFSHTNGTGRDSDSSREKVAESKREVQSEHIRILSPRNNHTETSGISSSPASKATFSGGPSNNENLDHSNAGSTTPPRLSQQKLQQFERQQVDAGHRSPPGPHQPVYTMSADVPKGQLNAMDDMTRSDASSSSFNLSTDAEDSEYEMLRRRLGMGPAIPTSTLDTSGVSAVSIPTAYTTDDERIFPALQTDDEMTQATNPSVSGPSSKPQGLLMPLQAPDDEPGHIQIFPMNNETEDDLRAWTISPSTAASKEPSSARSNASNQVFNFQNDSRRDPPKAPKNPPTNPPSVTNSRNTPGANRSFTSPKSQASPNSNFSEDFANFADFSNFAASANFSNSRDLQLWSEEKKTEPSAPSSREFGKDFEGFNVSPSNQGLTPSPSNQQDASLSRLLEQAKNKRRNSRTNRTGRPSSSSVNSAPAITASFLRQHHNLGRYSTGSYAERNDRESRVSNEGTSVSDIIQSLEATNQSRIKNTRGPYGNRSVGDVGAINTARAVKDRLREKRRKDREYNNLHKSRSSEGSSSENSDHEASESWLFDEVTGALGPRGIAADLESLSGRSNRSKSSQGNKSHRSHRSRSHRTRRSSSRRPKSSNDSVDSRGSRQSRNSRYSHRSTKSFLSQMSEQSRSVANDLLRLEMQLAMVGTQENRDDLPVRNGSVSGASIGAASRASRTSRKSLTSHRPTSASIVKRTKMTVIAPPGKLGIILANKADSKGTVVSGVRTSSVLAEKISPGDRIIAIDGEDVSRMTVSEITTIMSRKADYERTLTVLTTPKNVPAGSDVAGMVSLPALRSPVRGGGAEQFDNSFQQFRR